ncbi:MAG: YlxR family protein [Bacilli bacterium]|nr:YlxR family protein [Bacilli bacterium]MDD4547432.1 YlxR family protein [Bacilli bacterium]
MKPKKIPMRRCIVTKEQLPKSELIRIVRTPENKVVIDLTGKQNGRGAYLKKDINVIEKAYKNKILNKHLEVDVPNVLFEELREMIK